MTLMCSNSTTKSIMHSEALMPHQLLLWFLKIHKLEVLLRPTTSSINCPTSKVSKHLASILSPLKKNQYTVVNSCNFVRIIYVCTIDPQEIMVYFDNISLFTSTPTTLALQVTKNRLKADPQVTTGHLIF